MFEINSSVEITDACVTKFTIQTNGEQGGDAGHGSKTFLSVKDIGGTYMNIQARDLNGRQTLDLDASEITLSFGGDAEFRNFCKGIAFIHNQLNQITGGNKS